MKNAKKKTTRKINSSLEKNKLPVKKKKNDMLSLIKKKSKILNT